MAELFLGGKVDPASHERTGDEIRLDTADFTTHGVIVGMTGSGKTGLGVVLIEEVLAAGIPALLIDPKGDLTNLCLTFPALAASDFVPWIDEAQAAKAGQSADEFAAAEATKWTEGLAGWGYGPDQIAKLRATTDFTIYTPGSQSGMPLNLVGSLDVPATDDAETIADQVEGFVTGLLGLIGVASDPLAGREHILLSNLVHHAWDNGRALDLAALVGQVITPPMAKLGVFEVDQFFPPKDRQALAMQLNGLLASPSFAAWGQGAPLDIQSLLYQADGSARCAIITTAHLSDEERQFVTSLVLGALITWMRAQSGTTDLRALLYMDEVAGYLPPTAAPATKKPIMLLMKQARAFGVGVVLSTQNPVDIDYKAISNAGTWMVGRLQTERDKQRLLDGMSAADGGVDLKAVGDTISGLAKREFVMRRAGKDEPEVFTTRWAMSYLRGPLTRDQIRALQPAAEAAAPDVSASSSDAAAPDAAIAAAAAAVAAAAAGGDPVASSTAAAPAAPAASSASTGPADADTTPVMPTVADGIPVRWLSTGVEAFDSLGSVAGGTAHAAAIVAVLDVRYDETKLDLVQDVTYTVALVPAGDRLDAATAVDVDVDLAGLDAQASGSERYRLPTASLAKATPLKQLQRDLVDHIVRNRPLELAANATLKLAATPGESDDDFRARCAVAAQALIDADVAKVQAKYDEKRRRIDDQIAAASDRADVVEQEASDRKRGTFIKAAGDVLGGLFGSRRSAASKIGRAADQLTRGGDDEKVDAARNKVSRLVEEQAALDAALAEDISTAQTKWATVAADLTTTKVPAEKADVTVRDFAVVWFPTT